MCGVFEPKPVRRKGMWLRGMKIQTRPDGNPKILGGVQMIDQAVREANRRYWDGAADNWFGTTALPEYGVHFVTEDELHLFGDVQGKRMLEICCGSGHSLVWQARRGAGELWGLDISKSQLRNAERWLAENGAEAHLVCAPMEDECGIPEGYFDFVYSIYGLGWTTDLARTFRRLASYLKPGGTLIFSWNHPLFGRAGCVGAEGDSLVFKKSYFDQSGQTLRLDDGEPILRNYRISDYINALAQAGFAIERMIEQTDAATLAASGELTDKMKQAKMFPLSFVMKARKL